MSTIACKLSPLIERMSDETELAESIETGKRLDTVTRSQLT